MQHDDDATPQCNATMTWRQCNNDMTMQYHDDVMQPWHDDTATMTWQCNTTMMQCNHDTTTAQWRCNDMTPRWCHTMTWWCDRMTGWWWHNDNVMLWWQQSWEIINEHQQMSDPGFGGYSVQTNLTGQAPHITRGPTHPNHPQPGLTWPNQTQECMDVA